LPRQTDGKLGVGDDSKPLKRNPTSFEFGIAIFVEFSYEVCCFSD
jgi:hypothetical protein